MMRSRDRRRRPMREIIRVRGGENDVVPFDEIEDWFHVGVDGVVIESGESERLERRSLLLEEREEEAGAEEIADTRRRAV